MNKHLSRQGGFTLVELLITITILAILVGLSVPAYDRYTRSANRAAAKSALERIMSLQEAFYLNNKIYTNDLTDLGYGSAAINLDNSGAEVPAASAVYQISVVTPGACAGCRYEISAGPVNTQTKDTDCATFTLNSLGQKSASGPKGVACW